MRKALLAATAAFIATPALADEAQAPPLTDAERAQAVQELQELRARGTEPDVAFFERHDVFDVTL